MRWRKVTPPWTKNVNSQAPISIFIYLENVRNHVFINNSKHIAVHKDEQKTSEKVENSAMGIDQESPLLH